MRPGQDGSVVHTPRGWRLTGPRSRDLNRFLARIELRGLAAGSLRTYAFDLIRIRRWLRRRHPRPAPLRREDLYAFVRDQRGQLQAVTVNRLLRLLDRLRRFLQPEDTAPEPWRRRRAQPLPYIREPQTVKLPLTDRQVRQVVARLRTNRDRAILGLMWAVGLRSGEVLALRLDDVDWAQGTLHVRGKGHRERTLPLADPLADILRRYLAVERPPGAEPAVFLVLKGPRRGAPLTYAGLRRLFRYHRHCLKLPQAHPHRFRHTFAANMIRHGMSVPTLMRLLGHTWPATTLRYVHFDDREVRAHYAQALAELARTGHGIATDLGAVL